MSVDWLEETAMSSDWLEEIQMEKPLEQWMRDRKQEKSWLGPRREVVRTDLANNQVRELQQKKRKLISRSVSNLSLSLLMTFYFSLSS